MVLIERVNLKTVKCYCVDLERVHTKGLNGDIYDIYKHTFEPPPRCALSIKDRIVRNSHSLDSRGSRILCGLASINSVINGYPALAAATFRENCEQAFVSLYNLWPYPIDSNRVSHDVDVSQPDYRPSHRSGSYT